MFNEIRQTHMSYVHPSVEIREIRRVQVMQKREKGEKKKELCEGPTGAPVVTS